MYNLYHIEEISFLYPKHMSCDMNIYRSLLNSTGQSFTTFYKLVHLQPVVELPFWLTIWINFSQADLNAFFFTNIFILTQKLWTSKQALAVMGDFFIHPSFYLSLLPISLQSTCFVYTLHFCNLDYGCILHIALSKIHIQICKCWCAWPLHCM
jgi:hypothetical protein